MFDIERSRGCPGLILAWTRRFSNVSTIAQLSSSASGKMSPRKPYDAGQMRCYPVSTRINYVANDDIACSAPVELIQTQAGLFRNRSVLAPQSTTTARGYNVM